MCGAVLLLLPWPVKFVVSSFHSQWLIGLDTTVVEVYSLSCTAAAGVITSLFGSAAAVIAAADSYLLDS